MMLHRVTQRDESKMIQVFNMIKLWLIAYSWAAFGLVARCCCIAVLGMAARVPTMPANSAEFLRRMVRVIAVRPVTTTKTNTSTATNVTIISGSSPPILPLPLFISDFVKTIGFHSTDPPLVGFGGPSPAPVPSCPSFPWRPTCHTCHTCPCGHQMPSRDNTGHLLL